MVFEGLTDVLCSGPVRIQTWIWEVLNIQERESHVLLWCECRMLHTVLDDIFVLQNLKPVKVCVYVGSIKNWKGPKQKDVLTHLGSIVTSGARSTTGSSWASNTRSTTLTRESSVALKEKRDTSVTTSFSCRSEDEENVLFLRYSLLVQMGQRVHPHQEHPEQKKREGREGRHEDLMNKHSWHCIVCHAKLWNKDFEIYNFLRFLPAHQACQSHQ